MNLSKARIARLLHLLRTNPRTVRHLGLELGWSAVRRAPARPLPPSWPLPSKLLRQTRIRWPEQVPLPDARWWEPKLRAALGAHLQLRPARIDHPFTSILMFDAVLDSRPYRIAIDYRDSNEVPPECAASAALYFKLQFSNEGYPYKNVVPGGYVVGQQKYYRYLPHLRALRARHPIFDVYGRFGPRGERLRRRMTQSLREQERFEYTGGIETVIYSQFLWEAARARISIDLPGNGWLCYRLVEYLGIGACIVAVPHGNRLHVPLLDRKHVAYTRPDGEDVVDLCAYYMEHRGERELMIRNGQEYFDRYLHYRQLGAYYLSVIFDRLA